MILSVSRTAHPGQLKIHHREESICNEYLSVKERIDSRMEEISIETVLL